MTDKSGEKVGEHNGHAVVTNRLGLVECICTARNDRYWPGERFGVSPKMALEYLTAGTALVVGASVGDKLVQAVAGPEPVKGKGKKVNTPLDKPDVSGTTPG